MSRAERLLDLIQTLRRHRQPVSGGKLAHEVGVSIRAVYRDIVNLQAQGAPIKGEAGVGYIPRAGFMQPPLLLSEHEIEAVVFSPRWVTDRGDDRRGAAARDALAKIAAVLPPDLRDSQDVTSLFVRFLRRPGPVSARSCSGPGAGVTSQFYRETLRCPISRSCKYSTATTSPRCRTATSAGSTKSWTMISFVPIPTEPWSTAPHSSSRRLSLL